MVSFLWSTESSVILDKTFLKIVTFTIKWYMYVKPRMCNTVLANYSWRPSIAIWSIGFFLKDGPWTKKVDNHWYRPPACLIWTWLSAHHIFVVYGGYSNECLNTYGECSGGSTLGVLGRSVISGDAKKVFTSLNTQDSLWQSLAIIQK